MYSKQSFSGVGTVLLIQTLPALRTGVPRMITKEAMGPPERAREKITFRKLIVLLLVHIATNSYNL